MSSTYLYLHFRTLTMAVATLAAAPSALAQAPHGPQSFEHIVDASYSGRPTNRHPQDRSITESIRPDPLLRPQPESSFVGEQISLGRLQHAPPPKALRQLVRAQEAFSEGRFDDGVKRLEQAIEIHPNFIEARNNLGVQYAKSGRWTEAAAQFERAAELDPAAPTPHLNLAMALQELGQMDAAVANAEEAVRLAPQDLSSHYSLGAILATQRRRLGDAVEHLSLAESEFPKAAVIKAELLLQQGRTADAQVALRAFLATASGQVVR